MIMMMFALACASVSVEAGDTDPFVASTSVVLFLRIQVSSKGSFRMGFILTGVCPTPRRNGS